MFVLFPDVSQNPLWDTHFLPSGRRPYKQTNKQTNKWASSNISLPVHSLDYKTTTDPRMGVMCISPFFSRSRRYAKKLSPARLAPEKKGLYLRIYYIKDPFHFSVHRVEHWKLKVEYENCVTDSFCILLPNFACDYIGPI